MKVLLICCSVLCCIYWWLLPLKISVISEENLSFSVPTYPGDSFSLRFIHSVHRTPVWENFIVNSVRQMTLVSTEYQTYGVGMPSLPFEGTFTQKGDRFVLTNLHREFTDIPLRVGPEAKLCILHREQEFPIYEWLSPGAVVHVRIGYDYWWFIPSFLERYITFREAEGKLAKGIRL